MGLQLPRWMVIWFLVSSFVVLYDALYCLLRPRTMFGGDLFPIYAPYKRYADVDLNYGWKAFFEKDGFPSAQAALNLVEVLLQVVAVRESRAGSATAPLTALIVSALTLAKTVLYVLCEPFSGYKYTGHNSFEDFWLIFVLPTSFWITVPAACIFWLYPRVAAQLEAASAQKAE